MKKLQLGFTLVEMIMVIVIMGVIGGMVAVFMKSPIDAYLASARHAGMSDTADTALRRMARDLHKALPNSVLNSNSQCLELIPTKTGGRYRASDSNSLVFGSPVTSFNMLGHNISFAGSPLPADQQIQANDLIAVSNLGFDVGNAYTGGNTAVVSSVADGSESTIIMGSKTFPLALASPSNRFQVIPANENVVAFVCSGGNLYRSVRTFNAATCPATGAVLAKDVSSCNFVYAGSDLQRNGLVQLTLQLSNSGETVSLYQEVHVDNTP